MGETSLLLRLELRSGLPRPAGTVVLVNKGDEGVRVWRTGNQWGDTALRFELSRGEDARRVVRQPQVYTRNVPSPVDVPAGGKHEWPFELSDDEWEGDAPLSQLLARGAELVAVYDVPPTPESETHGVWTGNLRSNPVLLD